jgi:hypothetical protein
MKNDVKTDESAATEVRRTRRQVRAAIAFGVVMATIEMGVLLYFAYC